MSDAAFSVIFAGPLVTLQDAGRPGNMRFGVPTSGPMDQLAFEAAHAALGNPPGQTAIEISLGGLTLECTHGAITVAITGGDFVVEHAGQKARSWTVLTLQTGDRLTVRAGDSGSWAYLAFDGNLQSAKWLGSHATHSNSGFGGGTLRSGQELTFTNAHVRDDRLGDVARPDISAHGPMRVVIGPQDQHFATDALGHFLGDTYMVTDAYDRMGMRLSGPALNIEGALSIPSEPITRGAVQVSGDGIPTVLLSDHQTTGGYPKIATVISCDLGRLAQHRSGQTLRFTSINSQQAIASTRDYLLRKSTYLAEISVARGSLEQRLMQENLIHGWVDD